MSVLVLAEHDNHSLKLSTQSTIAAASKLKTDIRVLVAGYQCGSVAAVAQSIEGVTEVLLADHPCYEHLLAESLTPLLVSFAKEVTHIMAPASTFGKNILPRVAATLEVSQVSDVIEILDAHTYRRPIYAGNVIQTVRSTDPVQIVTVRSPAFNPASFGTKKAPIISIDFVADNFLSTFVSETMHSGDRPELSSANIVISGGRGLQSKENFDRLVKIAEKIGAAIGASRAAVDAGMAPNDFQVGQTGQVIAPQLYFAVGISGAIQHLAGMKDSKIIVAINKDPDAPIFQIADYGLVGDLKNILSEWESLLNEMNEVE